MLTAALTALLMAASVLAHELAHGWVALVEGDDTAQRAGRLTWNPLVHVDPLLTLVLPPVTWLASGGLVILGGAKPVPINPFQFRRGVTSDVLVSLAGVAANALIVLVVLALLPIAARVGLVVVAHRVIAANAALIAFNLLPIRPLDGWRLWRCARRTWLRRALAASASPASAVSARP